MSAGLSKKQIQSRIRYRLQKVASQLRAAGIPTTYRKGQVYPDITGLTSAVEFGFNISFNVYRASNGETGGFPVILVIVNGVRQQFGTHLVGEAGSFEQGIERIKQAWADFVIAKKKTVVVTVDDDGSMSVDGDPKAAK